MKNSKNDYYNPPFSHVYVEREVREHPRTRRILERLPGATVIETEHYKDVFNRKKQNSILQSRARSLIIGAKHGNLIYKGAPVCQSFGNENFYYTSCVMNCIFDCEYCYLKGMYPSGNMVVFVNLEDIFREVEGLLAKGPLYLCISYDTDLLAMEWLTGYVEEWIRFVEEINSKEQNFQRQIENRLTIEIRTKAAGSRLMQEHFQAKSPVLGVIYGFTLSPQKVIEACEHKTPALEQRIACVARAVERGFRVRLCFDPMIYFRGWEQWYDEMLEDIFSQVDMEWIEDVSVGSFRISQDYLRKMRRQQPCSAVVQFPFCNTGGVYHYPKELTEKMEGYMVRALKKKIPVEKIFLWEDEEI